MPLGLRRDLLRLRLDRLGLLLVVAPIGGLLGAAGVLAVGRVAGLAASGHGVGATFRRGCRLRLLLRLLVGRRGVVRRSRGVCDLRGGAVVFLDLRRFLRLLLPCCLGLLFGGYRCRLLALLACCRDHCRDCLPCVLMLGGFCLPLLGILFTLCPISRLLGFRCRFPFGGGLRFLLALLLRGGAVVFLDLRRFLRLLLPCCLGLLFGGYRCRLLALLACCRDHCRDCLPCVLMLGGFCLPLLGILFTLCPISRLLGFRCRFPFGGGLRFLLALLLRGGVPCCLSDAVHSLVAALLLPLLPLLCPCCLGLLIGGGFLRSLPPLLPLAFLHPFRRGRGGVALCRSLGSFLLCGFGDGK